MPSISIAPPQAGRELFADYERDGFLVMPGLFTSAEMGVLAAECDSLLERRELINTRNIRCRWANHAQTDECLFDCFDPVIDIAPVCRYFAHDERLLSLLRAIYQDEAHLFKDKLIFKRPGAKGYDLHQDFIGWESFPESFLTVIIAIDSTALENGATEVYRGYHQQGYLSPRDGEYHMLPAETVDESRKVVLELAPGDVAIFSGFTPHRSSPNHSANWRRQLYLSYNSGADGGEQRVAHYKEFHAWLKKKYAEYGKHDVWFK